MGKKKKKKDDSDFGPISESIEKKKPSIIDKFREKFIKPQKKKLPITFNVGVAILLFVCYFSVLMVSIPMYALTEPAVLFILLFVLVPTLYILIRYIILEREKYEQKYG